MAIFSIFLLSKSADNDFIYCLLTLRFS